jgi:hypothetical protein
MPTDDDRDPWGPELSREIARAGPGRPLGGLYADEPEAEKIGGPTETEGTGAEHPGETPVVPVRRDLAVAIAGFAALLGVGLILGAQSSGPDARSPYAIVIFGVQLLFVLSWSIAMRPPAAATVAGVCLATGLAADYMAVSTDVAGVFPLLLVGLIGVIGSVLGQTIREDDRKHARDAFGATLLLVLGVTALAMLIALTRKPIGTQAIGVCLTAAGVALVVARLTDAVFPKPRIAPQVPRGATGVVLGAMLGTLAAAALGGQLVLPFTPAKGAILGLVVAGLAVLLDLAADYSEAGRGMAGDAPTFWLARHMQGPLGAFAFVAPVAYGLTVFFLG